MTLLKLKLVSVTQNASAPQTGQNMETATLYQDSVPATLDWLAKIVQVVQLVLLVITVIVVLQAMIIMGILTAENLDTKVSSIHLFLSTVLLEGFE